MELGGLWWTSVLNSALLLQMHRPNTRLEHQDPVSYMTQKKRAKIRKKERKKERQTDRQTDRQTERKSY